MMSQQLPKAKQQWLFLIFGLAFLWIRNAPPALILPIWAHGDEMAHVDYVMKIGRGRLPRADQPIEPELFELHRTQYDGRYVFGRRDVVFESPSELGMAAFSYEAAQPPLPYLVFAAFRLPLKAAGLPLLSQVKALRLVVLLVVSAGLFILFRTLRRREDLNMFWSAPLLFIPLLPQDMYFTVNTDVFAFTAGCGIVWGMFRVFDRPSAADRWSVLAGLIALSIWVKITAAFFFALWPILTVALSFSAQNRPQRRKIFVRAAVFFILAGALAAPWLIINTVKHSHPIGHQFKEDEALPYKHRFISPPFEWTRIKEFHHAFANTLIRGEFLWHGAPFEGLPRPWNWIFPGIVFWIVFAAGLVAVFLPPPNTPAGLFFIQAAAGTGVIFSLFVLHFGIGGIPFYHARYAFAGLYPIFLIFAAGWRRLVPLDGPAVALPAAILFAFNIMTTTRLLSAVLEPSL